MFLRAMKDRCGNVVPRLFMSDDADQNVKVTCVCGESIEHGEKL